MNSVLAVHCPRGPPRAPPRTVRSFRRCLGGACGACSRSRRCSCLPGQPRTPGHGSYSPRHRHSLTHYRRRDRGRRSGLRTECADDRETRNFGRRLMPLARDLARWTDLDLQATPEGRKGAHDLSSRPVAARTVMITSLLPGHAVYRGLFAMINSDPITGLLEMSTAPHWAGAGRSGRPGRKRHHRRRTATKTATTTTTRPPPAPASRPRPGPPPQRPRTRTPLRGRRFGDRRTPIVVILPPPGVRHGEPVNNCARLTVAPVSPRCQLPASGAPAGPSSTSAPP